MSSLAPGPEPASTGLNSALACVSCARSKARCDRKIPCSRCLHKKLTCETRVSQRSALRVSGSRCRPEAINSDDISRPRSGSGHGFRDGSHGMWMDWHHHFGRKRAASPSPAFEGGDDALHDDFLTQLMAATASNPGDVAHLDTSMATFPYRPQPKDLFTMTAGSSPSFTTGHMSLDHDDDTPSSLSSDTLMSFLGIGSAGPIDDYFPPLHPASDTDPTPIADQIVALEGWPLFRCNPVTPSSSCQAPGAEHVKGLLTLLRDYTATWPDTRKPSRSNTAVEPLAASTRERVTAVLQRFFHEAQQLYGLRDQDHATNELWAGVSVLKLPPPSETECLLRAYVDCCEPHYPVTPLGSTSVNERVANSQTILPVVGLLLMMAVGAMATGGGDPFPEVAHGLVDICRSSLRRLVEQNISLASEPDVSQCAWLFIMATVWSGDKWQMDIGIYQKAMYLEMHLRACIDGSRDDRSATSDSHADSPHSLGPWEGQERLIRATYAWLFLDYEICLFQDMPSTSFLSVANLDLPLPSQDDALPAQQTTYWGPDSPLLPRDTNSARPSLKDWVACFTETNDIRTLTHVTPTTLRILLCFLMDQVLQLRFCINGCSSAGSPIRKQSIKRSRHGPSMWLSVRVHEAQELLQKWFDLAQARCPGTTAADCGNAALYHLVALETLVSFPEVERVAQGEPHEAKAGEEGAGRPARRGPGHHLAAEDAREVFFHCGQVLRSLSLIPSHARPPWWAAGVYRAVLIAWENSRSHPAAGGPNPWDGDARDELQLDVLPPRDASVVAYLNHQGGSAVFASTSGPSVSLADPVAILLHGVRFLESDAKTKFTRGIQQKLTTMARRWGSRAS